MDINERLNLIKQVGEEIISEEELRKLLEEKKHPVAYDGFEPSGKIHIAQGILRAINVNKMTKAGCTFIFFVADWHAWANNKMGGDLEKIQTAGKYFIEVWKACGMDMKNVEFKWASDFVKDPEYWKLVMNIARDNSVARIVRCAQIMGRSEKDALQASQILYPCLQAADIFYMDVDICQLGMDQRKVNVLARELAPKYGRKKPVIVNHHMLRGLIELTSTEKDAKERAIELKMSKSKPDTAIFMTDTEEDIKRKFAKAYCPEKQVKDNPILEYCMYIIFVKFKEIKVERPEKFKGNITYDSYEKLEKDFKDKKLHPMDLKQALTKEIIKLLSKIDKKKLDDLAKKAYK